MDGDTIPPRESSARLAEIQHEHPHAEVRRRRQKVEDLEPRDRQPSPMSGKRTAGTNGADSRWITIADASERLTVSPRTIRRMIADGQLPGYRIGVLRGRLLRVDTADVDALPHRIRTTG